MRRIVVKKADALPIADVSEVGSCRRVVAMHPRGEAGVIQRTPAGEYFIRWSDNEASISRGTLVDLIKHYSNVEFFEL